MLRGVALGIVQTNHGVKSGIQRMQPGDGLVYYSPKTAYPTGDPLKQFTAIGRIADGEAWQADESAMVGADFRPWRRRVEYDESAHATEIAPLLDLLELTRGNKNWGFIMRRGQVEVTKHDFDLIAAEMGAEHLRP
ncbi:EVE domain-containing protein [soil metagenome]